ncbi:50S ribosomal protein L19 [Borrelia miyamotoi]|uniref:50S ribosomal protein L19 n=1 Tax=Borrelia miyamotoi TaxID=47466 RepID=UPI001C757161|nr:50S ribosomal protein L19 [Borrelia miyamotoi]BCR19639.1 50S ribosomal protein L19 [Borrelia miyamotoi]BCR20472.1 50S ribosomal protein L19 [Borrelia miyamotoi]
MDLIRKIEAKGKRTASFDFRVGDTVCVSYKIIEGTNERVQNFEGLVISIQNKGIGQTFLVRKISSGIGVEKIFPMHSPIIEKVKVLKRGKVRKAKLYYMRDRIGKAAMKVKERLDIKKLK